MINITGLIRNIQGFDPNVFTEHKREEALIASGHHRTAQGWFDKNGQWLGKTDEDAIKSTAIQYEKIRANRFYALDESDEDELLVLEVATIGVLVRLHGVLVWGKYEG